jgi:hypothetical protein
VDGDIGAVQSRIDVHYSSDYYSRKKITVTRLNFVCKRRAPLPPPKRLTVFRKIRSEQIFQSRARSLFLFANRGSADELRLFAAQCYLIFCFFNTARRALR